jgi:hypothetical protein
MHRVDLCIDAMAWKTPGDRGYGFGIEGRGRLGRNKSRSGSQALTVATLLQVETLETMESPIPIADPS